MTNMRALFGASLVAATLAFALPWFTHFGDGGISLLMPFVWLGLLIAGFVRHGWRGLWLLLGAPLVLYWPVVLVLWSRDAYFRF